MTFTKGFLNPQPEFKRTNLIGGLLLWTLTAYIFYAFFQLYREAFRFFTGQLGDNVLLILTPTENYIYNFFYATIASSLGFSIALRFTLQNSIKRTNWRTLSLARRTLNSEGFWTWSFLLWFGKLGSMLGIWYLIYAMQYNIDFIQEFWIFLVLLPIVFFYSSWPSFSRLIRSNKAIWFFGLTIVLVVMSFGFSFKNFTDYNRINENILNHSIEHVYDLRTPTSQSHERIYRQSLIINIYVIRDTLGTEDPAIFIENIDNRVLFSEIQKAIAFEKEKVSLIEKNQLIANLHIDERISMKHVNAILDEFRKANLTKIQYSTGRKYSKYPADYPGFKHSGIQKILFPEYYPEFENFLDSVEQVDLTGKTFKLSESLMYRNAYVVKENRIEIYINSNYSTLNGQKIDAFNLERKVYQFIKKYSPNYIIILNIDDEIAYGRYIEILDMLWTQVDKLRNKMSLERYDKIFDQWYWEPELDTIKNHYPRNILEWTTEEQRLNELIKKAGNSR